MKYLLILLLLTLTAFAGKIPTINGHTLNIFDSKPATVADKSGNGNDGTVYYATLTTDGMDFDSDDDWINFPTVELGTNATVSYWVNYKTYGHDYYINQSILLRGYLWEHTVIGYCSKVHGNSYYYNNGWLTFTGILPSLSNWINWTWVHNSGNATVSLYTNGIFAMTKTMNVVTNINLARIGECLDGYNPDARVKQLRAYKRLLAPSEISTLYNAGRNASIDTISTNELRLFYDFTPEQRTLVIQ